MKKAKILVVDDEVNITQILEFSMGAEGYEVITASNGEEAIDKARKEQPDLIILDIMMPRIDGYEACRILKANPLTKNIPVVLLTAKGRDVDKRLGYEVGATDYIVKPFYMAELVARIKTVLRRSGQDPASDKVRVGEFWADGVSRTAGRGEKLFSLSRKEFDLLYFFLLHPGRPWTREQLLERVWGYRDGTETRTVDIHIRRLRTKIEEEPSKPRFLRTVWGVGYVFAES